MQAHATIVLLCNTRSAADAMIVLLCKKPSAARAMLLLLCKTRSAACAMLLLLYNTEASDLHGTIVGSSDASRAAIKDHTLIWWASQLDGSRQEPLADGVHAILSRHKGLEKVTQLQTL